MGRLEKKNETIDELRKERNKLRRQLNKQEKIEQCMRKQNNGSMKQICRNYAMCEKKHR